MKASEIIIHNDGSVTKTTLFLVTDDQSSIMEVDPETAAAVAKTIVDVIKFFNDKNEPNPVERALEELKVQIEYLTILILQIINILEGIRVEISENTRRYIVESLKAKISTIVIFYKDWESEINDDAFIRETVNKIYLELIERTREAISYGFAHYDSIGLALITELSLAKMLGIRPTTIKTSLLSYKAYFEAAINPNLSASKTSLAYTRNSYVNENNNLRNTYQPKEYKYNIRTERRGGRSSCTFYFDVFMIISGNVQDGFTYRTEERKTGSECESRDLSEDEMARTVVMSSEIKSLSESDAYAEQNRYNNAHRLFKENINRITVLETSLQNCKAYLDQITEFINNN